MLGWGRFWIEEFRDRRVCPVEEDGLEECEIGRGILRDNPVFTNPRLKGIQFQIGPSLHLHLHFGLPMVFHSAMVFILPS